jgi:hypothetical protein
VEGPGQAKHRLDGSNRTPFLSFQQTAAATIGATIAMRRPDCGRSCSVYKRRGSNNGRVFGTVARAATAIESGGHSRSPRRPFFGRKSSPPLRGRLPV